MKAPKPLNDLYSDLRDRNLLPVVAVLVLALVAVPVLLGGGGEEPVTVPVSAEDAAELEDAALEASQLAPVVFAETPSLREYEERLGSFQSRNPFRQQASKPPAGDEQANESGSGGEPAKQTNSNTSSGSADSGSSQSDGNSGSGDSGGSKQTTTEHFTIYYEIDVKVGPEGEAKKRKDVELLEYLPDRKAPVLQFVGVTPDISEAIFVVSRQATGVDGKGECIPNDASCEFLALEVGQEHRFLYEPDGLTYKIKLTDITEVEVRSKQRGSAAGASALENLSAKDSGK